MENKFTITDLENKFIVSIQFDSDLNPDDKNKLHQMIAKALELWDAKEKFSEEAQLTISNKKN